MQIADAEATYGTGFSAVCSAVWNFSPPYSSALFQSNPHKEQGRAHGKGRKLNDTLGVFLTPEEEITPSSQADDDDQTFTFQPDETAWFPIFNVHLSYCVHPKYFQMFDCEAHIISKSIVEISDF